MENIQNILKDTLSKVQAGQDELMKKAMIDLDKVEDEGMKNFLTESLMKAKGGKISFEEFTNQLNSKMNG